MLQSISTCRKPCRHNQWSLLLVSRPLLACRLTLDKLSFNSNPSRQVSDRVTKACEYSFCRTIRNEINCVHLAVMPVGSQPGFSASAQAVQQQPHYVSSTLATSQPPPPQQLPPMSVMAQSGLVPPSIGNGSNAAVIQAPSSVPPPVNLQPSSSILTQPVAIHPVPHLPSVPPVVVAVPHPTVAPSSGQPISLSQTVVPQHPPGPSFEIVNTAPTLPPAQLVQHPQPPATVPNLVQPQPQQLPGNFSSQEVLVQPLPIHQQQQQQQQPQSQQQPQPLSSGPMTSNVVPTPVFATPAGASNNPLPAHPTLPAGQLPDPVVPHVKPHTTAGDDAGHSLAGDDHPR